MTPLAKRIKRLRRSAGLSQTEIAAQLHLSPQSVQQWEAGKTTPRGKNLERLAKALGSTPNEILFGGSETQGKAARGLPVFAQGNVPPRTSTRPAIDAAPEDAEWYHPPIPVGPLAFALRVEDPYLAPVIDAGDIVVIEPGQKPDHLSLVALREGPRVVVLQYHQVGRKVWAQSLAGAQAIKVSAPARAVVGVVTAKIRVFAPRA